MNIQYTGKARVRVEGVGVFEPGQIRAVSSETGRELRRGAEFRDAPSIPRSLSPGGGKGGKDRKNKAKPGSHHPGTGEKTEPGDT